MGDGQLRVKRTLLLALPFLAGVVLAVGAGFARELGTVRDVLLLAGLASLALGVVLLAVYALTRFVAWAARRE
jgi:uncharacterized membrane protein YdcZ (DUF606 family)